MTNNTIWGDGSNSVSIWQNGSGSDTLIRNNVVYRYWTSTPVQGTMANNTVGGSPEAASGGSWPAITGQIITANPGFNNTAVDDYRVLSGASSGRGVSWRPSDFHYGP
jgi:hypothetical protein